MYVNQDEKVPEVKDADEDEPVAASNQAIYCKKMYMVFCTKEKEYCCVREKKMCRQK